MKCEEQNLPRQDNTIMPFQNFAVEDPSERGKRKAELKEEHRKLSQKRFEEKMQQRCAKQSLQTITMLQRPSKERRQRLDEPAAQMLWEPQKLQALDEPAGIWWVTDRPFNPREWEHNVYLKPANKWWDFYRGEDTVLIPEITIQEARDMYDFLKMWGEVDPFRADAKYQLWKPYGPFRYSVMTKPSNVDSMKSKMTHSTLKFYKKAKLIIKNKCFLYG